MPAAGPRRVALYSPDRTRPYDGRTRDAAGVGGGITARLSLVEALARLGHSVTAYVNCEAPVTHAGVSYVPLDGASRIDADVFIAISTGGALSFAPLRDVIVTAGVRMAWVQGVPKPAALDAVRADYIVTASRFLRDACATRWSVNPRRLVVIHNGIHQTYFRDIERDPPARSPFAIAYIGPPDKGLEACIRVLRRLRQDDERYHLDVYGGSPLWGGAPDVDPGEPGLRLAGLIGQRDLARALYQYEYCLALQSIEEGFGIAAQEARRAGAIVIASAVGAFPELFEHGRTGYLIAGAHASAAAQSEAARLILALTDAPLRRARIRRRAPATPFDWDAAAREWTAHWEWALAHGLPDVAVGPPPVTRRTAVLVGGYYGHRNLGDEAILQVLLDEIDVARPDIDPIVASADPTATTRGHDVRAIDERRPAALRDAAAGSAFIVLGGGGLLHDHFGVDERTLLTPDQWGLAQCAAYAALSGLADKPLLLAAVGAGPLNSIDGQRLARLVTERADAGTVRDVASLDLLGAIGAPVDRLRVAADPAWRLPSAPAGRGRASLRRLGVPDDAPLIAVALRAWGEPDAEARWSRAVSGAIDRLVAERGCAVVFIPFHNGPDAGERDDAAVAARVRAAMRQPDRAWIAPPDLPPSLVQSMFETCALVVAMRLHGVILAANAGTPVVALRYDDKVADAARAAGLGEWMVDLEAVSADRLADRLAEAMGAAVRARAALAAHLPALREAAGATAALFRTPIDAPRRVPREATPEWNALIDRARQALDTARPSAARGAGPAALARRLARTVLPAPWRRALREAVRGRLMSPEAAAFDRYRRERLHRYGGPLDGVVAPGVPGLVSVVLPVRNGEATLAEAIDSILCQSHQALELIIVNDGSTDGSAAIAEAFARRDSRVRVVHQEHRRLPAALNRGFDLASGEFLTWTSADNRLAPNALALLVACLRRHRGWDAVYGDLVVIGEDGRPFAGSGTYASYRSPAGSARVRLPADTSELNTRANNIVGAGFLYRSRAAALLGPYSDARFGNEDYDYWLRANALLTLRHADCDDPVVEYRSHAGSLTARSDALGLLPARDRLMIFDRFRRDLYLAPACWMFAPGHAWPLDLLRRRAAHAGHIVIDDAGLCRELPPRWLPVVCVGGEDTGAGLPPRGDLPAGAIRVLCVPASTTLPDSVFGDWDLCLALGEALPVRLPRTGQGWLCVPDEDQLFQAIDIRAKLAAAAAVEAWVEAPPPAELRASVIIATRGDGRLPAAAIESALAQRLSHGRFEVIVVNNRPGDARLAERLDRFRGAIRTIAAPVAGVSAARNAGLGAARGEYVVFLDDDATARPGWLEALCAAFDRDAALGVAGGPVVLQVPTPRPPAFTPAWASMWSHFTPGGGRYREVRDWRDFPWGANWSARRSVLAAVGGFPLSCGREAGGFGGGEELVAAWLARRLGARVAVVPEAVVDHHVDPSRFTFEHVRRTMVARYLAAWRARRDLLDDGAPGLGSTLARLALHHVDPRVRAWPHLVHDIAYRKSAQWRLLVAQWQDLRDRRRQPVVARP